MKTKSILSLLLCGVAITASTASAQVAINYAFVVPFGESTQGLYAGPGVLGSGTYWNALYQAYGFSGTVSSTTSWADDGISMTGVGLAVDTDWSWSKDGGLALLDHYAFTKSTPRNFAFSGIPNGVYDLVLYSSDGGYSSAMGSMTIFTVNGITQKTANTTDGQFVWKDNYVIYTNVNVADGMISGTYEVDWGAGGTEAELNGAQLILKQGLVVFPPTASPAKTVYAGTALTLQVLAGVAPTQIQWRRYGTNLPGETASSLSIPDSSVADSGPYDVAVTNAYGGTISTVLTLTVISNSVPYFTLQPASVSRHRYQNVTFAAAVAGTPPIALQWSHNDSPIANATNLTLTVTNIQSGDAGTYVLTATNRLGGTNSSPATLVLASTPEAFVINFDFDSYGVQWGSATPGTYAGPGVIGSGTFWNSIPQPDNGSGTFTSTNAWADDGVTDVGVTLSVDTVYSWGGGYTNALLDDFATSGTTPMPFVFRGVPDGLYRLVLFGANGGTGSGQNDRGTLFTVNGVTLGTTNTTDAAFVEGDNYVVYTNLLVTGGSLSGTYEPNPVPFGTGVNEEGDFCGAQLQCVVSRLTIQRAADGNIQVSWPQGVLLEAGNPSGPWSTNSSHSPYIITPAGGQKFYRVVVQ